jgi:deoxyribonucleoside regulator
VGVSLEQLRAAAVAIAVISGESKHAIARAVVSSSLCSVLITDEATARAVLDQADSGTTIQERS